MHLQPCRLLQQASAATPASTTARWHGTNTEQSSAISYYSPLSRRPRVSVGELQLSPNTPFSLTIRFQDAGKLFLRECRPVGAGKKELAVNALPWQKV